MRLIILSLLALLLVECRPSHYDLIIRKALVYDGSGNAPAQTDVGIRGDSIVTIGDLSRAESANTVDAEGLALAPGFIDAHSHHDRSLLTNPDGLALVSQGITTIVVGQDGFSHLPLNNFFTRIADTSIAVNLASYSGHNTLREIVMGSDFQRTATQQEIDSMKTLLIADLNAGALGLSTGLEYDPGIYSSREEVLALAKVLPQFQGRYISHIRSEDRYFWDALDEILVIGREAGVPVQISHIKLAMRNLWGRADSTLQVLKRARDEGIDVTADIYPYAYWSSTIRVLFPNRNFTDVKEAELILTQVTSPEGIILGFYAPNPEYEGRSLAYVADKEKIPAAHMLIELIRRLDECEEKQEECGGSIVATSMEEEDIKTLMRWEYTGICSDGNSLGRHPRGFGAFTRVLSKYVREDNVLSLEEGISRMTYLTAENLGIQKRGLIKKGYYADLVLFDTTTISDQATIENPHTISEGVQYVWVNGELVFTRGETTNKYPGQVLKRK
jgi:N-acyl-D-amino-acid deacylase